MSAIYPYVEGDPLRQRNTYAYAPYYGRRFVAQWRRVRQAVMEQLPPPAPAPPPLEAAPPAADGHFTAVVLETELKRLSESSQLASDSPLLRLLQRFEISKRIHGRYSAKWRPEDPDDYDDLSLYVRFAEVLDTGYDCTRQLDLLSALLKCLDTLCALWAQLDPPLQARLRRLLQRELNHIDELEQEDE